MEQSMEGSGRILGSHVRPVPLQASLQQTPGLVPPTRLAESTCASIPRPAENIAVSTPPAERCEEAPPVQMFTIPGPMKTLLVLVSVMDRSGASVSLTPVLLTATGGVVFTPTTREIRENVMRSPRKASAS